MIPGRFIPPFLTDMRRRRTLWHSELGIDRVLADRLRHRGGYYVELGANDGIRNSNTAYFERALGWRGVLVEPTLNNFLDCRRYRSDANHIVCAACVPFDYADDVVWLHYSDLMTSGLRGDVGDPAEHANRGRVHLKSWETVVRFPAAARTLQSILDEASAPAVVDLLSLDVEGAERSVLEGIDHQRQRFRYMVIECWNIDAMVGYVESLGYKLDSRLTERDLLFALDAG